MGITIHWKGSTNDKEIAYKVIGYAKFMADALKWPATIVNDRAYVVPTTIVSKDSEMVFDHVATEGTWMYSEVAHNPRKYKAQETEEFGVLINPPEPMRTETIAITFYRKGGMYIMKEFCKTQVFSNDEVQNLAVHQILISMLMTIKATWIRNLEISDEASFYIPHDPVERDAWLSEFTPEYRDQYSKIEPFNFEVLQHEHSALSQFISELGKALSKSGANMDGAGMKSMDDPYTVT